MAIPDAVMPQTSDINPGVGINKNEAPSTFCLDPCTDEPSGDGGNKYERTSKTDKGMCSKKSFLFNTSEFGIVYTSYTITDIHKSLFQ